MNFRQDRHGGDIFRLSPEERRDILDFSININPLGLSPRGAEALKKHWEEETLRYPDPFCRDLTAAFSAAFQTDPETAVFGNGATELIYLLPRVLRPKRLLVPAPCFSEYGRAAAEAGIPVDSLPLSAERGFQPEPGGIARAAGTGTMIFWGHPNNPDGRLLTETEWEEMSSEAEARDNWIVLDESFIEFAGAGHSLRTRMNECSRLIILGSLTKFYAVPGLRIGYCLAPPDTAAELRGHLFPWNVGGPVQRYMTEALQDGEYRRKSVDFCRTEGRRLAEGLKKIPGLQVFDSMANFILCRILGDGADAAILQSKLEPHRLLIRQCANYEGLDRSYFRAAVKDRHSNDILVKNLEGILSLK